MLYLSIFISAILCSIAIAAARRPRPSVVGIVSWGIIFTIGPIFLMMFFPPVGMQFMLLTVTMLVWRKMSGSVPMFIALSLVATLTAYGAAALLSWPEQQEIARLRTIYPYESMEQRVPAPDPSGLSTSLPQSTQSQLTQLEEVFGHGFSYRSHLLRRLHEDKVALFVNSAGFGQMRMIFVPNAGMIESRGQRDIPTLQPGPPGSTTEPSDEPAPSQIVAEDERFASLHCSGILDFANRDGFGYVKDRQHVAGFQAHRFSEVPEGKANLNVRRLELLGLILKRRPVVYVSENLPRMEELRDAPTRPLDTFEVAGLERLRAGEQLFVAEMPNGSLRMLGALRSVKQCVECHGGERGDLLGAFTYTLESHE